jgi:hypothetical protein
MIFTAEPEKTRFDFYFGQDMADALNATATTAAHKPNLDPYTVAEILKLLAQRFRLEITP